jgi:hypothetical protein
MQRSLRRKLPPRRTPRLAQLSRPDRRQKRQRDSASRKVPQCFRDGPDRAAEIGERFGEMVPAESMELRDRLHHRKAAGEPVE